MYVEVSKKKLVDIDGHTMKNERRKSAARFLIGCTLLNGNKVLGRKLTVRKY